MSHPPPKSATVYVGWDLARTEEVREIRPFDPEIAKLAEEDRLIRARHSAEVEYADPRDLRLLNRQQRRALEAKHRRERNPCQ